MLPLPLWFWQISPNDVRLQVGRIADDTFNINILILKKIRISANLDIKMTLQEKNGCRFTVSFLDNFWSTICDSSSLSDAVTVLKHNRVHYRDWVSDSLSYPASIVVIMICKHLGIFTRLLMAEFPGWTLVYFRTLLVKYGSV